MNVAEILTKAAAEIDKRGWCRGVRQNYDGEVCLAGAVSLAMFGHPNGDLNGDELSRATLMRIKLNAEIILHVSYTHSVSTINDEFITGKDQALMVLLA